MNILHIFAGIALIVLAAGMVNWVNMYMEGKKAQMKTTAEAPDDLTQRLDDVEGRLRDVLDVMLALSEKMDRWERDGVPASRDPATPS